MMTNDEMIGMMKNDEDDEDDEDESNMNA